MATTKDILVESIIVPASHRTPREAKIASLAASLAANKDGLLQNIMVRKVGADYLLVFGAHRLAAAKRLGWKTIRATVTTMTEPECELAEIDENLQRANLTAVEEVAALARREQLYLLLHPETNHGGDHEPTPKVASGQNGHLPPLGNSDTPNSDVASFADDTAAHTGKSPRTVRRDVAIGKRLTPAAQTQLAGTQVENNKTELRRLAALPPSEQLQVARAIGSGKAKTVEAAKTLVGITVPPEQEASPAATARAHIKVWSDATGRWLGQSPSIDDVRNSFPSAHGDTVVRLATELYEALNVWRRVIR